MMTFEFRNFMKLNVPYKEHVKVLRSNWYQRRIIVKRNRESDRKSRINSAIFRFRYLLGLQRYRQEMIDLRMVTNVLHRIFPSVSVLGDKYPDYVFHLDVLGPMKSLIRLVIYRDCRDVVNSTLKKARTNWRDKQFVKNVDTADKAAKLWVRAIELMEHYSDTLYSIRYEDLIQQPQLELEALGKWLDVDASGFPAHIIKDTSIGKYKSGLTHDELKTVMEIAGPTMERLGYEI